MPDTATAPSRLIEFTCDLGWPRYKPFDGPNWSLAIVPVSISQGYWSDARLVRDMAVLTRRVAGVRETWMSLSPMEIESQDIGSRLAQGHVVIMGLGMGWSTYATALRPDVTRVTVVERDPEVIRLIAHMDIVGQLPDEIAARVEIVNADALEYRSPNPVDTLLADIWLPLNGDDRIDQVRTMMANTGARRVYVWGQEMVIARAALVQGLAISAETVADIIADIGLPLLGPELPDYPEIIKKAAQKHLKG